MIVHKNTVCLWFDGGLSEAAAFYCATFPDTRTEHADTSPVDNPGVDAGEPLTLFMTIMGIPTLLLNGGSAFKQSEAFSFQVATETQEETDRLWDAIVGNGGQESACGWCKDKWGVSWQITPRQLTEAIADPDREAAGRAMEAMMTMHKIDIAAIEAARAGKTAN